ncbi:MAG: GNAT family N-acetyltransferase [Actinomycetota bacterium]|nr:GNAT family N-acetyltransferase [Actinomycetota bacterium]
MAEVTLRNAGPTSEESLWLMLYYASHSNDQKCVTPEGVRRDPYLARYVAGWGRPGDSGVIAELEGNVVGAAWVRLLVGDEQSDISFVDAETPELAVAVLPGLEGQRIGTAMMERLFEVGRGRYPAIVLTVRKENPAMHLYERLGFETVDSVTNRVGTESVKMVLTLD